MNGARFLSGWAEVRITGAAPERVLAAMAERGVAFWGAAPPEDFALTVRVGLRAAEKLPRLALDCGCEAVILRRHGLPALFSAVRRRYVLLACLALALVLANVSGLFIWDIGVEGNDAVPEGVIRAALADCGVDIGAYWPRFSQDAIRNSVILRVPDLRWMTVSVRGSHARVIVREERKHIEPVDETELVNVVAKKAGIVDEVHPKRGTQEAEIGDTVLPGDVLIGGYSTGRAGVQGPVRATGPVWARTWYELSARAPLTEAEKTYTGGKKVRWALLFGKTRINFYKGSSICPAGCDKITYSYPLEVKGVFTLPLTVEKTVLLSYDTSEAETEGLEAALQNRLMAQLLAAIGDDGQVREQAFTRSIDDGAMTVTLRAECREQIGKDVPLTAEDIYNIQSKIPRTEEDSQ